MKQAIFLAVHNGEDGMGKEVIVFATTDEQERDKWINSNAYYKPKDVVADLAEEKKKVVAKLDGLERLAIGLTVPNPVRTFRGIDPPQGVNRHSIQE